MMDTVCGYCSHQSSFENVIEHLLFEHCTQVIKFREQFISDKIGKRYLQSKEFNITPDNLNFKHTEKPKINISNYYPYYWNTR